MDEEEAIEHRILDAYSCGKINKNLYYELDGIADILKALMDEKISKKIYFELLGFEKTQYDIKANIKRGLMQSRKRNYIKKYENEKMCETNKVEIKNIIDFEDALDNLISSKLKDTTQERIKKHFGSVALQEYIKLVVWSSKTTR